MKTILSLFALLAATGLALAQVTVPGPLTANGAGYKVVDGSEVGGTVANATNAGVATNAPDGKVISSLNQATNIAAIAAQQATNGFTSGSGQTAAQVGTQITASNAVSKVNAATNLLGSAIFGTELPQARATSRMLSPAFAVFETSFEQGDYTVNQLYVTNELNAIGAWGLAQNQDIIYQIDAINWTSNALSGGTIAINPTNFPVGAPYLATLAHANGIQLWAHVFYDSPAFGNVMPTNNPSAADNITKTFAVWGFDGIVDDNAPADTAIGNSILLAWSGAIERYKPQMIYEHYDYFMSYGSLNVLNGSYTPSQMSTTYPLEEYAGQANILNSAFTTWYSSGTGAAMYEGTFVWRKTYPAFNKPGNYIMCGVNGTFDTNSFKCGVNTAISFADPLQVVQIFAVTNLSAANNIYLTNALTRSSFAYQVWNDKLCNSAQDTYSNAGVYFASAPLVKGVKLTTRNTNNSVQSVSVNITNLWPLQSNTVYVAQNIDPVNPYSVVFSNALPLSLPTNSIDVFWVTNLPPSYVTSNDLVQIENSSSPGQIATATPTGVAWSNAPAGGGASFALTNGITNAVVIGYSSQTIGGSNVLVAILLPTTNTPPVSQSMIPVGQSLLVGQVLTTVPSAGGGGSYIVGYTNIGASTSVFDFNLWVLTKFTAPASGTIDAVYIYSSCVFGTSVKLGLYADSAGVPGALVSGPTEIGAATWSLEWHPFTVSFPVIAGNTYWIAEIANQSGQISIRYDWSSGSNWYFKTQAYSDTWSDPLGTAAVQAELLSVKAHITAP